MKNRDWKEYGAMSIRISQRLGRFRDKRIKTEFGMSIMDRRCEVGLAACLVVIESTTNPAKCY